MLAEMKMKLDMMTDNGGNSGREKMTVHPMSAHSERTAPPAPIEPSSAPPMTNKMEKQISFGQSNAQNNNAQQKEPS